jgi:hypothetical protein
MSIISYPIPSLNILGGWDGMGWDEIFEGFPDDQSDYNFVQVGQP